MSTAALTAALEAQGKILERLMEQMRDIQKQSNDTSPRPKAFKGKSEDAERFVQALKTWFRTKSTQFGTDEKKIGYALALCEDEAVRYATPLIKKYNAHEADPNVAAPFATWALFEKDFLRVFGAADSQMDAQNKMDDLVQGRDTISEYTTKFGLLAEATEYSQTDLLHRYKRGLNFSVKKELCQNTYDTYTAL
jgi:hypothetical protein